MANPNSVFDQVLSTTLNAYRTKVQDNIFNGTRAYRALLAKGVEVEEDSGAQLVVPVQYAKGNAQWMAEYDTLQISPVDVITAANYAWKILGGTATVSDLEIAQNQGKAGFIKLAKAKVGNVTESLKDQFNLALFNDGSDAKQPAGLVGICSNSDPSAGALGGIGRAANTFWKAGFVNSNSSALSITDMVSGHIACSYGTDEPDLILTSQHLHAAYEALLQGKQYVVNMDKVNGGISDLYFKGCLVEWDRYCPDGDMFFLTSKNLKIYCLAGHDFNVEPPERKVDQFVSVHKVAWMGQIVVTAPRTFGALTSRS